MNCLKHPDTPSAGTCSGCAEPFCTNCLVTVQGKKYCADCKSMAVAKDGMLPEGRVVEPCKEATWSLVLGIISIPCCGVVLGIVAIVLGVQAKNKIAKNPGMEGSGKATAGIVLGIVGIFINILGIIIQISRGGFRNL